MKAVRSLPLGVVGSLLFFHSMGAVPREPGYLCPVINAARVSSTR